LFALILQVRKARAPRYQRPCLSRTALWERHVGLSFRLAGGTLVAPPRGGPGNVIGQRYRLLVESHYRGTSKKDKQVDAVGAL